MTVRRASTVGPDESDPGLPKPRFGKWMEEGEVVERTNWHKAERKKDSRSGYARIGGRRSGHARRCGCELTTDKGAYRDVTVEYEGYRVHYYHQSPVVVTDGETYRLDGCGYRTKTTRERLNWYLPSWYYVQQRDHEWFLLAPSANTDNRMVVPFEDGIHITVKDDVR